MGRIRVLPDTVANKIAAGEVVERPASAVKELLENSLDAGATRIRIDAQAGGRREIRVDDNGIGMIRDDAMLAIERHATSKLRSAKDLFSIRTLGFRGEALPSIASVSRFTLETASEQEDPGVRIEVAGGRIVNVADTPRPPGTTITVSNLFYNVPARRKFLRTDKTELAHIASLVTHYSLAHIDKSFTLTGDKGPLLSTTPVEQLRERVYQVFGSDTLDQLVEMPRTVQEIQLPRSPVPPERAVEAALNGPPSPAVAQYGLHGFVSKAHIQKLNRNSIYVFVNRRLIRDRVVLKAITSAYHNVIPPGTFPFALLFIDIPFEDVDVNVHPSKTEVRFRRQSFVHDFVRDSIRDLLVASKPVSSIPLPRSPGQLATRLPFSEATARLESAAAPPEDAPRPVLELKGTPPPIPRLPLQDAAPVAAAPAPAPAFREADPAVPSERRVDEQLHSRAPLIDTPPESLVDLKSLRPLGQLRDSFIIAAHEDGLWIIDQHVAHERILFEKTLLERFQGEPKVQRLLMPIILTLRPGQELALESIEEEFRGNGFEIEPFGNRTIAVKATPASVSPKQAEALIQEILETPERELRELSLDDLQKRMAATIACHAAIKVNMPLDGTKMRWLLDELARTDCPMACPHGRPIALKYPVRDILKAFHRI